MTSAPQPPPKPGGEEFGHFVDAVVDYAIFTLTPDGHVLTWNRGATRTFGCDAAEAAGSNVSRFYLPDHIQANRPARDLQIAVAEGRFEDEGWRLRADGTPFWATTVITAVRDHAGGLTGFVIVTRDLTERRRAEENLRRGAETFQLLVASVRDYAIFMLDAGGHIATWNIGAQRIKGYAPGEIIGKHFSTFYPVEDIRNGKPEWELQVARERGSVEDTGWRIRKDGTRFWANVVITAVYDNTGELRGFAKVTRDLTHQREVQEQIRQTNEIFQLLVSSVRDYAIFMLDANGFISTWNQGAERIKQYRPEEIIGKHFSQFYSEEDKQNRKPEKELEIARAEGSVEDIGWRIRKDGTRFWANVVITAVRDENGVLRGFAKVTRDITERKLAEETERALLEQREARLLAEEERRKAEASYRVAQEANRAKDEFLMTLSHELRTPMTTILGWARLLPTMSPDDPVFTEAVHSIARGAQLQSRLIDDILDVSRVVSGKLRLAPETVEIGRVVVNAVDGVNTMAEAKEIQVTTTLAPGLGSMVADPTRIQQVIWNLLSNAVKFTPRRGAVNISAQRTGSQVQISVTDSGEGIDPAFLPHVFEPFRQAEMPQTRAHGGLGLGLSIVRYIVEAHGGTVTASSPGRGLGSTFTVTLPVRAVAHHAAGAASESPFGNRLHNVQILLVDDDSESRAMVTTVLRSAGAEVQPVGSATAALSALESGRPDLILTDIAMPEVDGYTLTRQIRMHPEMAGVRIVALSAFPPSPERNSGFDAYLSKPIDPFRLVDEVARVTARN